MSGRCKSCNKPLSDDEMKSKDINGNYTDICFNCIDDTMLALFSINEQDSSSDFYREGRSYPHNND